MSHGVVLNIDVDKVMEAEPIKPAKQSTMVHLILIGLGVLTFVYGLVAADPKMLWGAFYVNLLFWMGLSVGGVMTTCIFQIVRAKWAPPLQRIAEANVNFLLWAYIGLMVTYFGKDYLFPWGAGKMPGREWWMGANFVYFRFLILFGLLFLILFFYVKKSLRSDIGVLRERASNKERWKGGVYRWIATDWKGADEEVKALQVKRSIWAPAVIAIYAIVYSLFSFEMIMGMDTIWFSNMFGGWNFIGNIYMGWAAISLLALYFARLDEGYAATLTTQQMWDIGKLTFGFCMLWGYMVLSQYLPQWYGNLPEETAWLLVRLKDPWMCVSYIVLGMCFVIPFIMLLSEDIKKSPVPYSIVCCIILLGMWLEKYVVVVPQLSPDSIPLLSGGLLEVGFFLGFFGLYMFSIHGFMKKYPYVPFSHPMSSGSIDW